MCKPTIIFLTTLLSTFLLSCGRSEKEKALLSIEEAHRMRLEDSAALKIAAMPTIDCMPLFVAKERGFFDTTQVDVRVKLFTAQMDCDTAVQRGRVEALFTDLVRTRRMQAGGTPLRILAPTALNWTLIGNRQGRITRLKNLTDKMLAMTRYSATDMLSDFAVDSAKLQSETVFRVQVNDVSVRYQMLQNNVIDALFLPEPQATLAIQAGHHILLSTSQKGLSLGVLAISEKALGMPNRKQQLAAFMKGYEEACDSLNKRGLSAYSDIMARYCNVPSSVADSLQPVVSFPKGARLSDGVETLVDKWIARRAAEDKKKTPDGQ